jgi:hypothetical protein
VEVEFEITHVGYLTSRETAGRRFKLICLLVPRPYTAAAARHHACRHHACRRQHLMRNYQFGSCPAWQYVSWQVQKSSAFKQHGLAQALTFILFHLHLCLRVICRLGSTAVQPTAGPVLTGGVGGLGVAGHT